MYFGKHCIFLLLRSEPMFVSFVAAFFWQIIRLWAFFHSKTKTWPHVCASLV